ncbi:pilus assembly protein [Enterobacter mori]|uniref:pilus assembly protein n=1 Tax=Enterobacter mori TaxID=539813 RepID=UPI00034B6475|nr:pilus assembly protein [Enterobacter mori]BBT92284.1 pilus protein [Enterobacter cloacae]EKS6727836.1 pilus assembly protein [Enterobacter mori]MBT1870038.1 pilus assembly protein [Enterobacter mori]MBW8248035.1 fimbrial protein [Enterobacter mori]MBW8252853.1 fimbrial protein [Enterobacter mori]
MKNIYLALIAIFCLFSSSAWALNCYKNGPGGSSEFTTTLPAFNVPANAPPGQKIWESGDLLVTVYCDSATRDHKKSVQDDPWSEDIFVYILDSYHNTDSMVTNNPNLAFGVTYNGIDYDTPDIKIDTGACLDKMEDNTRKYQVAACNGTTIQKSVSFTARFRLYVKLKTVPKAQFDYTFPKVTVLTFDGIGGINVMPDAKNLHYDIDGLDNIHFLDCGVNIKIYPENQIVNFGQFNESTIKAKALTAPFSVSTIKDATAGCTEQFDVTTSFYTTDTLYDDTHLDIGNGLLMRLIDKINGDVIYNQYLPFATYRPDDTETTLTHDYTAELTRKPGEAVTVGPFSKDIIVKINYQ